MAPRIQATRTKRSFEDTGIPKQELGNEEIKAVVAHVGTANSAENCLE